MPRPAFAFIVALVVSALSACQVVPPVALPIPEPAPFTNPAGVSQHSFAFLTPADVVLFLQFDNLSTWRDSSANAALATQVWKSLKDVEDPQVWAPATAALGVNHEQLRDRIFGRSLAFVGGDGADGLAYAVWSRVEQADLATLPAAMQLKPISVAPVAAAAPVATKASAFSAFTSNDGKLLLAFQGERLLLAPARHRAWFDRLTAFASEPEMRRDKPRTASREVPASSRGAPLARNALAKDNLFQDLLLKLPADRSVLLYTQDAKQDGRHLVVVTVNGEHLSAHYAARIKKFGEFYQQFERVPGVSFGVAPSSAIAAASVNLIKKDNKGMGLLNVLVFPKNMEDHVLPKLTAPMVVYLTSMPGSELNANVTVRVPVGVVAIRLKDRAVADDLDRIVGGFHLLANLGELNVLEGVFGGSREKEGDVAFRVADFGQAIVKRIKDPAAVKMFKLPEMQVLTKISYGRVGDWYVLCSQEKAFRQLVKDHLKREATLDGSGAVRTFKLDERDDLIFTGMMRAPEMAALSDELAAYWAKLEAKAAVPAPTKEDAEQRRKREETAAARQIRKPMEWIADAIKHRHSFGVQVWRDEAGDLRGMMRTVEGEGK